MSGLQLEVLAEDFVFLEGPRWHQGALWFSDMWDHTIYRMGVDGVRTAVARVPGRPSGLAFLPDGRLLTVSMADRKLYLVNAGELTEYADLSALVSAEINDCVMAADGSLYVGNFGYDLFSGEEARTANLVRVAPDGSLSVVAEELMFPNGSVITDKGRTLICAETFASQLTAYTIAEDGSLSERRVWAALGEHTPDGICLDAEGAVWVSSFVPGEFLRVTEGGDITASISAGGKRAVACNLGGDDGRTLFALTFAGEIEDISSGQRLARVETCRVDVPAAGSP